MFLEKIFVIGGMEHKLCCNDLFAKFPFMNWIIFTVDKKISEPMSLISRS
jgi:hypothetical protein